MNNFIPQRCRRTEPFPKQIPVRQIIIRRYFVFEHRIDKAKFRTESFNREKPVSNHIDVFRVNTCNQNFKQCSLHHRPLMHRQCIGVEKGNVLLARGHGLAASLRLRVSPPIRQALTADAFKQLFRAHRVTKPELLAMVVAKVEFSGVAVQVVRTAMLIHAINPALEDAEESFNRVCVCDRRARILPRCD